MRDVSDVQTLTKLTPRADERDLVLSLDADELRHLQDALRAIADSSRAAALLASAIEHALRNGNVLVLGATEGAGPAEEEDMRTRVMALVDGMVPDLEMPSEAMTILARRNAKRRAEVLQEFGALTGEQIAEERSRAANRHALAARWRKEGKLFGVPYRGQILYPAFQFDDDGGLRPVISDVLAALPRDQMSDWEIALWWTAANGLLDGRRPVDLLDTDPRAIVLAGRELGEPLPL
jgi:hypothetical protein